jgi:hypothetical protein
MQHTLYRIAHFLETVAVCEPQPNEDDLICPITMKPIKTLSMDEFGISYEKDAIEDYITKYGTLPTSDKPVKMTDLTTITNSNHKAQWQRYGIVLRTDATRYRLILTVMCFTKFKFDKMHDDSLRSIENKLLALSYNIQSINEWWPAKDDKALVFDIAWIAFESLRSKVYAEFILVQTPKNENNVSLNTFTRAKAREFFKCASLTMFFSSKTDIMNTAIHNFIQHITYNPETGHWDKYITYENGQNITNRTLRWNTLFDEAKPEAVESPARIITTETRYHDSSNNFPRRRDGMSEYIWYLYGCPQGGNYC